MISKWFCLKECLYPSDSSLKPKEKFQEQSSKESEENTKQFLFVSDNNVSITRMPLPPNKDTFPVVFSPVTKAKWLTIEDC